MALPSGITPKSITIGIASFFDGTIASGRVTISAPVNVIHTPTNRPIFSSDMTKPFVDGAATFDLCPTDAPGLNRIDWVYKAKIEVQGAAVQPEAVYFLLPSAGPDTVDLDGLVTVPSSAGIPISVDVLTTEDLPAAISTAMGTAYDTDAERETLVPARLSDASLKATYGPASLARPGNRAVFLGDSVTAAFTQEAGVGGNTTTVLGSSWPVFACALSDQRIQYVSNAGVWGNTTAQMIARFTADVAAHKPGLVTILGGTNDGAPGGVGTAWSNSGYATWQANIRTLVGLVRGIGAVPVLCTLTPRSDTAGAKQGVATWNKWLRRYAAHNNIALLDFYRQAVDPTTGGHLASYASTDGVHPGVAGHLALGQYVATTLAPLLPTAAVDLLTNPADTDFLFASSALFTGTPTGGVAGDWSIGSAPSGSSFQVITDSAVPGNMQQITAAATGANNTYLHQGTSIAGANAAVGDVLAVSAVVTNTNTGAATELSKVRLSFGPGGVIDVWASSANVTRARVYKTITVPSGANQIDVAFHRDGGNGTFAVGQVSIVNLTKLGIVTP